MQEEPVSDLQQRFGNVIMLNLFAHEIRLPKQLGQIVGSVITSPR